MELKAYKKQEKQNIYWVVEGQNNPLVEKYSSIDTLISEFIKHCKNNDILSIYKNESTKMVFRKNTGFLSKNKKTKLSYLFWILLFLIVITVILSIIFGLLINLYYY